MNWHYLFHHFRSGILVSALLLPGCAAKMQMSPEELRERVPNDGIVVGSVQIKGGQDLLGRNQYTWVVERVREKSLLSFQSGYDYVIKAYRDKGEEVFVTRLAAGDYHFCRFLQTTFSTFRWRTNIEFKVHPGKTTYIGRLTVEFPPGVITGGTEFELEVEDEKGSTLWVAKGKYGLSSDDVVTDLMKIKELE